ncbi:MAG: pilus assembly protein TadG-related protein [Caulobacterales bacterium]|nr:pilus assembly protein TadG-related protein [Caulobacterales bacterium]
MMMSLLTPALIAMVGGTMEVSVWTMQRQSMQHAADAAALWAAKGMALANVTKSETQSVAENVVRAEYNRFKEPVTVTVSIDGDAHAVEVTVSQPHVRIFSELLPIKTGAISVRAEARLVGGDNICVIGLDEQASGTVSLDSNARMSASNCGIYSNSTSGSGLKSYSNALLHAKFTCSAGGYDGGSGNFAPTPVTDCPPIDDPLVNRAAPPIGACDETNMVVKDKTQTLYPGVYCGGLTVDGNAEVWLSEGVYVMLDGPLVVDSNARLEGEHVGFYFSGNKSVSRFASNAVINLSAPRDGGMAGLLFFEDRNSKANRKFEILSNYARELLGTIYLPKGRLFIDADTPVADKSAFTVIVARRLELYSGPNLVLNTDYGMTDVPVPEGVGPVAGDVVLSR